MHALKLLPILIFLSILGSTIATVAPATPEAPTTPETVLGGLIARTAPGLSSQVPMLEAFLPPTKASNLAGMLDRVDTIHTTYLDADTPHKALQATARLDGFSIDAPAALQPLSLMDGILGLYSRLGITPTPAELAELGSSVAALDARRAAGLAILVQSVLSAMDQQSAGLPSLHEGALGFFEAAAAAQPLLGDFPAGPSVPLGSLSAASTASACAAPFEDPQKLVWLGTACDDVLPADGFARVLQVDPAGNDQYYDNAGGAGGIPTTGAGIINAAVTNDRELGELLDNVTLGPLFPLDPENQTWVDNLTVNIPGEVDHQLIGLMNQTLFLQEWIAGFNVSVMPTPENARHFVPIAFAVDFAGNDLYSNDTAFVQGAGVTGSLGVLLDLGGDDEYVCWQNCQGNGNNGGLGILADADGADHYTMDLFGQASGDSGHLFDLGGNDHYTGNGAVQGAHSSPLIPRASAAVLFDRSGDDVYQGGDISQGAGNFLIDLSGTDSYTAANVAQGAGSNMDAFSLLLDGNGNDVYTAANQAQGHGYRGGGLLADLSGDDHYTVGGEGQGSASSGAEFGFLYDQSGNDVYDAGSGQGRAHSSTVAALVDVSGNDIYTASGSAQGVSAADGVGGLLGLLLDADGDDHYSAGDRSQGSGGLLGTGMLLDVYGHDTYQAGDLSQGSGGDAGGVEDLLFNGIVRPHESGVGILMDGTQDQARATVKTDQDPGQFSSVIEVSSPPNGPATADSYTAGDFSQGSSGPTGGIGLLLDREDKGALASMFTAGERSQGSATLGGLGLLANANGKDEYHAGAFSQGASDGGLGALLDESGKDTYAPTDPTTSHGYGFSTTVGNASVGLGLLIDAAGADTHPGMANNACQAKGSLGLAVDTVGASIPPGCLDEVVAGVTGVVTQLVAEVSIIVDGAVAAVNGLLFPAAPGTPTGTIYLYDNVEDTAASTALWNVTGGTGLPVEDLTGAVACLVESPQPLTTWRIRNQTTDPQLSPNAHTGSQYWYAGNLAGPAPVGGYTSCSVTTLTSDMVSLASATAPELRAWIGGSSESTFDFLRVYIKDITDGTTDMVVEIDGGATTGNVLPMYAEHVVDLTPYVGDDVQVVFEFTSDIGLPDGQGYNVDDVLVAEA